MIYRNCFCNWTYTHKGANGKFKENTQMPFLLDCKRQELRRNHTTKNFKQSVPIVSDSFEDDVTFSDRVVGD